MLTKVKRRIKKCISQGAGGPGGDMILGDFPEKDGVLH